MLSLGSLFNASLRCRPTARHALSRRSWPQAKTANILLLATSMRRNNMHTTSKNGATSSEARDKQIKEENDNVKHSQFMYNAAPSADWTESSPTQEGIDSLPEGKGKLSSTSSHLFKLILPLGRVEHSSSNDSKKETPPTVILLHPSQPLSHVTRLINASLKHPPSDVSFRSQVKDKYHKWSDSTDIGDFVKDAANQAKFSIFFRWDDGPNPREEILDVRVPTFADRTRYIRRRLEYVNGRLKEMEGLKRLCDKEAHRGARRMALTGFGMLVVYWGAVARLTFWDYGWEVMEPVTYLSGLSTVICGYLWFLYQGREVSYSSVLDHSISSRREQLYRARGLDIEQWVDLVGEAKSLKAQIRSIAKDYDRHDDIVTDEEDKDEDAEEDDEGWEEGRKAEDTKEMDRDREVVKQRKERERDEREKKEEKENGEKK